MNARSNALVFGQFTSYSKMIKYTSSGSGNIACQTDEVRPIPACMTILAVECRLLVTVISCMNVCLWAAIWTDRIGPSAIWRLPMSAPTEWNQKIGFIDNYSGVCNDVSINVFRLDLARLQILGWRAPRLLHLSLPCHFD